MAVQITKKQNRKKSTELFALGHRLCTYQDRQSNDSIVRWFTTTMTYIRVHIKRRAPSFISGCDPLPYATALSHVNQAEVPW